MPADDRAAAPPRQIRVSPTTVYTHDPELVAVRGAPGRAAAGAAPGGETVVARFDDEGISVIRVGRGRSDDSGRGKKKGDGAPVYRLGGGGGGSTGAAGVAVPTARVFVRFREGVDAKTQGDAIARAGFKIVQVPPYAPHAAWVEPESGGVKEALNGFARLAGLKGIEHVEPQMLMAASRK